MTDANDIVTEGDAEQYVADNPDEAVLVESGPGRLWFVQRDGSFTVVRHEWVVEDAEEMERRGAEVELPNGDISFVDADEVPADGETLGADEDKFVHPLEQMMEELEESLEEADGEGPQPPMGGGL